MDIGKIKETKDFLAAVIDGIPSPLFVIDQDNKIESINDAFLSLFDKQDQKKVGSLTGNAICCANLKNGEECGDTSHCLSCVLRETILDAIQNDIFIEKKYFEKEFRINGKIIKKHIRFSIKPLSYQKENFFICIFDDVSDEYKLEEKLLIQNEKIKLEMLMARGIQAELLPKRERIGNVRFSFLYRPCETLGGDFLTYYPINRRYTGVIIADVSGHGLVSSMFTVFLFSIIDRTTKTPKKILENIFYEFSKFNVETEMYITVLCGVIDRYQNKITLSNAGFPNYPAIIRSDGIEVVKVKGMPISNWTDEVAYEEVSAPYNRGDRLVMFSDGITEMNDKDQGFVGSDYLYELLSDRSKTGKEVIRNGLYQIRSKFHADIKDDISILVADYELTRKNKREIKG